MNETQEMILNRLATWLGDEGFWAGVGLAPVSKRHGGGTATVFVSGLDRAGNLTALRALFPGARWRYSRAFGVAYCSNPGVLSKACQQ